MSCREIPNYSILFSRPGQGVKKTAERLLKEDDSASNQRERACLAGFPEKPVIDADDVGPLAGFFVLAVR